ncbi:MAG: transcription antitermination factor NusB, partial [Bacteroidota bacterium]
PELVLGLYTRVFFKSDPVLTYFASRLLFWEVNQAIIKSMLVKTLKHAAEEEEFPLADITKNGEDDLKFFEMLFTKVINENDFLEDLIQRHTKNWDVERVALTDRILLKLASVEMMYAPSIPVKVSINEVIEISKTHSTPKSKQFVNGVLDVLSNELTSRGKIRKSGRGLIDNK